MPQIVLPTLHAAQAAIRRHPAKFKAIRCGRRFGKSEMLIEEACNDAAQGAFVGLFFPGYKYQTEIFHRIIDILLPIKRTSNRTEGVYRTKTGGRLDFWSLDNEDCGRSRKYHKIHIDECSLKKGLGMVDIWEQSIKPTLLDYDGEARIYGTPKGVNDENFFYRACHLTELGFINFHAPTWTNPHLSRAAVDRLRAEYPPLVFAQEFGAEFVDWSGDQFFNVDNMLAGGLGHDMPPFCDYVFAVIDTANKSGKEHDGTGVMYFALQKYGGKLTLYVLDYDLVQIDGAFLETWLPTIYQNLESLAVECRSQLGSAGVFIEDKASGIILLQQARAKNCMAEPIDSKLTLLGKDERAINISGKVFQGLVKITKRAVNRIVNFKQVSKNHMISQIKAFRPGDKDAYKRADDLLDCFCYGVAIALGNTEGY